MLRSFDVVLIAVMVAAASFTYQAKHKAEEQVRAVQHLQRQIRLQHETIDLLKADWSVLSQPARLQKLTEQYDTQLDLKTIEPTQVATLNDLPTYPEPENPPIPTRPPERQVSAPLVAKAPSSIDMTETGSVVR